MWSIGVVADGWNSIIFANSAGVTTRSAKLHSNSQGVELVWAGVPLQQPNAGGSVNSSNSMTVTLNVSLAPTARSSRWRLSAVNDNKSARVGLWNATLMVPGLKVINTADDNAKNNGMYDT